MTTDRTLEKQYEALQKQWRQHTKDRKHHYLPYVPPRALVDFVLVAKMTSIAEKDAEAIRYGDYPSCEPHVNLYGSLGDCILHYGARRHLCKPGETYYVTDLGKCAIPPQKAKGKLQEEEFTFWYPKLLEELALVAKPGATVVPVGSATGDFLKSQSSFKYRLTEPILHWSRAAIVAAKMASSLFPQEWKEFRQATSWEDLSKSTEKTFGEAGLSQHTEAVQRRIKEQFRDIHRHYMFTYKKEMPLRRPDVS